MTVFVYTELQQSLPFERASCDMNSPFLINL